MVEIVNEVGVTLVNASASDDMVAMAAWVSHDADSEDRLNNHEQVKKLIDFLYRNKHLSPFEHGLFTFKIDAPLFVAREFFRHRTASYNEVSGRYTEMAPRFYAATVAREQHGKPGDYYFEDGSNEQTAIYLQTKRKAVKKAWKTYQDRLEAGIAKEQAREELPLSLMTQWYVTMNPRNLMQFLTLRNEKHALKEIQDVAVQMEKILKSQMPYTYAAYLKGRKESEFNKSDLEARVRQLTIKNEELTIKNKYLEDDLKEADNISDSLRSAKADIEARYAEIVDKYNRKFVAEKEAEQAKDYQTDPDSIARAAKIGREKVEDTVIPVFGKMVEDLAPIYNVYVDVKGGNKTASEIAKDVATQFHKLNRNRSGL
jgi:thymidylate synthase (FAD)